ncbi:MAG: DUF5723 family protein [Candidatus Neomarinimicrobiota bacterium]
MNKNKFLTLLIVLATVSQGYAQLYMNPRSISLAGAYATLARGGDVIGWNPANLGLYDNPKLNLNFGVIPLLPFPALQVSNDAISPWVLNKYFFTGEYLDDAAKDKFLSYFPDDGININPLVQMRFVNFSIDDWAFTLGAEVTGKVVAPKSLFHLALFGNEFGEAIDLSDTDLELQSVVTLGAAHGWEIRKIPYIDFNINNYVDKLAVGVAAKILVGAAYAGFDDLSATATTYEDKVVLDGSVKGQYGIGGTGLAVDLGAAAIINKRMTANLALNNVIGFVHWGIKDAKVVEYSIFTEIPSSDYDIADSLIEDSVKEDTTYAISGFSSNYPAYLLMGFEYRVLSNLHVMANYRQYFSNDLAAATLPAFSVAGEYYPLPWLPVRAGMAVGGTDKFKWGFGSGLAFNHYHFDWGFAQIGGFFNHGKGIAFCFDQSLIF